jgi:hypothetical protein
MLVRKAGVDIFLATESSLRTFCSTQAIIPMEIAAHCPVAESIFTNLLVSVFFSAISRY